MPVKFCMFRQYGFKKKRNTTQAVLNLVTNLYDIISKNKLSSLVAIDLTKAFDTVNHKILQKTCLLWNSWYMQWFI